MEWNVASELVDELKKQGRFDSLKKQLDHLCEQKEIFNDVKYAMQQMLKEEYESILRKSKNHPALQLKIANKRVLGEELSALLEKRFPWEVLRKDIVEVFLSSVRFRTEVDRFIDETLDVLMEKSDSLKIETPIVSGVSTRNTSNRMRKTFKMESLLNELFGPNDLEKTSSMMEIPESMMTHSHDTESTLELPEIESSANDSEELEEGELVENEIPSDDKVSGNEKTNGKLAIGKSIATKMDLCQNHRD
jgi:hypothetical protein